MLTLADMLASHRAGLSGNILPDRGTVTSPPRLYSPSTTGLFECKGRVTELAVRREWEDIASYFGCRRQDSTKYITAGSGGDQQSLETHIHQRRVVDVLV